MNNSLKNAIYQNSHKLSFNSNQEKIFCSCVIYKVISNFIETSDRLRNSINSTIQSYQDKIIEQIKSYKNSYVSYSLMEDEVNAINKKNFFNYNDYDINRVYQKYLIKNKIIEFDLNYFAPEMYNTVGLSIDESKYAEYVHKEIMGPIIKYFINNYNITSKDISIQSAKLSDIPFKKIKFKIKDIYPSMIKTLIKTNQINIKYIDCEIDGDYFIILTK